MNVLWLVTARSGSQSVPHKNIRPLGGLPLLAWRILSARQLPGRVWLSTDSPEYAALGALYGAEVPFLRPAVLSSATASSGAVCLHAMEEARAQGLHFDVLGLLQPTSPFVRPESIQRGLAMLVAAPGAQAVVAVRRAQPGSLLIQPQAPTLQVLADRLHTRDLRRQALPQEITPCGGFFLARWEKLLSQPNFYTETSLPLLLEGAETLDIDEELDWAFAEFLVETGRVPLPCIKKN